MYLFLVDYVGLLVLFLLGCFMCAVLLDWLDSYILLPTPPTPIYLYRREATL